mmetsp:Transcript_15158/g.28539  ORF Transcript_15158/g.28539 Transcript_15158/m.28539 type:complete len:137 (-) Transcript_15158:50-460(-)
MWTQVAISQAPTGNVANRQATESFHRSKPLQMAPKIPAVMRALTKGVLEELAKMIGRPTETGISIATLHSWQSKSHLCSILPVLIDHLDCHHGLLFPIPTMEESEISPQDFDDAAALSVGVLMILKQQCKYTDTHP